MKVTIIGAGRMGLRHGLGALQCKEVKELVIVDINQTSLDNAKDKLSEEKSETTIQYLLTKDLTGYSDVVIDASTAENRLSTLQLAISLNPRHILIEKPIGQSMAKVTELMNTVKGFSGTVSVNLNMRLYEYSKTLKKDLRELPQFKGMKFLNFSGGSHGIGANGIHYLDFLFFMLDADSADMVAGEIGDEILPSRRGANFGDFGGWSAINLYKNKQLVGKSMILLSNTSTVFGGWEIIGSHGRIRINELEGTRVDILRNENSKLPVSSYAGDYLPPSTSPIFSPLLNELTQQWLTEIANTGKSLLPAVEESLKVHELLFNWLNKSKFYQNEFPIT